jgi:hypothetical protein
MKRKSKDHDQLDLCKHNQCPACGSGDIEGQEVEIGPGTAGQDVRCFDCNAEWREYYTLKSFSFYTRSSTK